MELVIRVLTWLVLASLMLAIATQLSNKEFLLPPEGFVNGSSAVLGDMVMYRGQPQMTKLGAYLGWANGSGDMSLPRAPEDMGQDPKLGERDRPYVLLDDTFKTKKGEKVGTKETSEICYRGDFSAQTQKVGNFIQRTNNYKRGVPDSCSGPLHEFVGRFYVPDTLEPTAVTAVEFVPVGMVPPQQ